MEEEQIEENPSFCVSGTHPWCTVKGHHYRGSQMIALPITTGEAPRL